MPFFIACIILWEIPFIQNPFVWLELLKILLNANVKVLTTNTISASIVTLKMRKSSQSALGRSHMRFSLSVAPNCMPFPPQRQQSLGS